MDPRTKAIDDVREIFSRAPSGPPPRVCPSCGAEHATNRAECPSCGKRYDRRFARVSDTQRWILAGVALARRDRGRGADPPRRVQRQARQRRPRGARAQGARRRRASAGSSASSARCGGAPRTSARPPPARPTASRSPPATSSSRRSRARSSPTPAPRVKSGELARLGQARELRAADPHARQPRRSRRPEQDSRGRYDCVAVERDVLKRRQGGRPLRPPVRRAPPTSSASPTSGARTTRSRARTAGR